MNVLHLLGAARQTASDLPARVHRLIEQADAQTEAQWELINQARAARGEPPIASKHPFRPRDLIDPREGEEDHE